MNYYSKIITMFALFTPRTVILVYVRRCFLCPNGSIIFFNIRLSNPILKHPSIIDCMFVLGGTGRRQPSLYIYISNSFQLCQEQMKFAMLGIIVPVQQRPPTKRVVNLLSPLLVILTPTLPPTALISTDVLSAIYVQLIPKETSLPDGSISPAEKRLPEQLLTKPLFSSLCRRIMNTANMWQSANSASVSVITLHGYHVIQRWCSITATSLSCKFSFHTAGNRHFLHGPPLVQAVQDIYTLKVNLKQYKK